MDNIQIAQRQYIANWHDSFVNYIRNLLCVVTTLMASPDAREEDKRGLDSIKLILNGQDAEDVERDLASGVVKRSTLDKIEKLNKDLADTCLEHIHVINGKTGVDVHIIKALLLRAACTWEVTKDYQALYEYTDGFNSYNDGNLPEYAVRCNSKADAEEKAKNAKEDDDKIYLYPVRFYKGFDNNIYKDYQLNSAANKFAIVRNPAEAKAATTAGKIPVVRCAAIPVDYVTEYKFTRKFPDGRTMTAIGRFSRNEAAAAGLFDKDTYAKYARILIGHRAFTYGAREIASDTIFGVMETTELKITSGITLSDGDIKEVDVVDIQDQ